MTHENTNTFPLNMLVTIIIVVAAIWFLFIVFLPPAKAGTDEMSAEMNCVRLGQIRHDINVLEVAKWVPGQSIGQDITETDLMQLPPGCGQMYQKPCNSTTDCQQKIRDSIGRCWSNIKREPETTGTCLTRLEINATAVGNALNKANICSPSTGTNCWTLDVPKDMIVYDSAPQQNDTLSMVYEGESWLYSNKIKVNCIGKCKA